MKPINTAVESLLSSTVGGGGGMDGVGGGGSSRTKFRYEKKIYAIRLIFCSYYFILLVYLSLLYKVIILATYSASSLLRDNL